MQLRSTVATVNEMDSGDTSLISVCVDLTDVQGGLQRDVVLILDTAEGTASGILAQLCIHFQYKGLK